MQQHYSMGSYGQFLSVLNVILFKNQRQQAMHMPSMHIWYTVDSRYLEIAGAL